MTPIAALLRTDTRPALLVSSERIVIDFNRALGRAIGSVEKGSDLAQYCVDRTDAIDAYLRQCAATRDPLPGVISFRGPEDHAVKWRCDGGVVEPATAGRPATVLIRLRPRADAHVGFLALKQQMESLHRDLHERKILQGQLEEALAEKQVLLSEVHHRVKNNLQIITSMLSLGLRSDDPSAALEQAIARVQAIGVVQELLYAGQKFREIECGEMLRAITSSLATVHGRDDVSIDVECAAVRLDVDRATSVALIVTELVINAYKHAFPELGAGNIRIGLARSGGANTLTVADDGVPFPDAGDRSGTGLRIAQALARKLGGELEVNTGREKSVSVTFPIPEGGANAASSEQSVHGSIA